jgi:hypothetical protein
MGVNGYRITDEAMLLKNDLDLILARDPQSAAQIDQVLELALMPKPVAGR